MNKPRPIQEGRLLLIMRVSLTQFLIMILIATMAHAAESIGQDILSKKVTVEVKNKKIYTLLEAIEQQTGIAFTYGSNLIDTEKRISVSFDSATVKEILSTLFTNGVGWEVVNNEIILHPEATFAEGLELTVEGVVRDENNEPLPGVNIIEKGTSNGVTTDFNGRFALEVKDENSVLLISFIGYASQEVAVGKRTNIEISLVPQISTLDEILVVGYGTVKKSDLTGSVASVKSEQLTAYPASGAVQSLQGRAAGVNITSNNAEPGGTFKVRVRGGSSITASSDPIYVVDGFVGGILPPPEDIASVEVLKDASATAIYGSRGANGVVIVTTKKGKSGAPRIEFNSSLTSQTEINRLDLMNADQYVAYIREVDPNYQSPGASTDWQDQVFQRGFIQNYQLSLSGGSEDVTYYISGVYFDQEGIITNSSFDRFSLTSNIDIKASEKFKIGLNMFAQRNRKDGVRTQEGSGGTNDAGVIASAFRFMPDVPVYRPDGTFSLAVKGDPIDNPYAIATELTDEDVRDQLQANFYASYDLLKNLTFRTNFGLNSSSSRNGEFVPTTLNRGRNTGGAASISATRNTNFINENYLTWTPEIHADHNVSVMGGYSYQSYQNTRWSAASQSFITNSVNYWNLGNGSVVQAPSSDLTDGRLSSFYSRLNYGLKDRYLLTFNGRYDGSSNFSNNYKWAFFPSAAFAWNMTNEDFFSNVPVISNWKWRVSYGLTGNQAISPYETLAKFSTVFTIINGVPVNAARPTAVANENLTWETTAQFNVGADIGLFGDRVSLTLDYYRKVTSDLLLSVPLPSYSGYSTQLQNVGEVENRGFEFTVSSRNLTGPLTWNMDINGAMNRNKVLSLPGGNDILYTSRPGHLVGIGDSQVLREGYPVGSFFGWIYDGVYQTGDAFLPGAGFEQVAGGERYLDVDGRNAGVLTGNPDGTLNADDRRIIGDPNPKIIWGFNNDFSWKNFDLNVFFQGSYGNDLLSYTLLELETLNGTINSTTRALNRWTPENTNTDVPKVGPRTHRVSSRWIYDGSYARLKNLALGYTFPKASLDRYRISRLRIYASAQNLLTFTKYEGYDPEVNYQSASGANSNRNLGIDYASYPNAKSYTVGLNVGF